MEPLVVVVKEEGEEEEVISPSSTAPHAITGLYDAGPPPFLTKMFEMVEDPETDFVISWTRSRNSFMVWDSNKFSISLLPKYFKHSNFSSFIRQLNTYGFRKVDPDRWEFAHQDFLGGQRHLLKNIKRRRNVSQSSNHQHQNQAMGFCVELWQCGAETEIDRLKRDRNLLMLEIVKLRQQQQNSRMQLIEMEQRIESTERKQRQSVAFLTRAIKNPMFVQELLSRTEQQKLLVSAGRKRRLPANLSSENLQAQGMENLFDSIEYNLSSCSRSPKYNLDFELIEGVENVSDSSIWQKLLNDDELVNNEIPSPEEVKSEQLAAEPFEWGEEMQELAAEMGFLDSKP